MISYDNIPGLEEQIWPTFRKPSHGLLSAIAGNAEHKALATLCLTAASEDVATMQVLLGELP